jgi:release factor glutamine methyltransferase
VNLANALQQSVSLLEHNGVEDSYFEARVLLGRATNLSAVQIYTEPEQILSQEEEDNLIKLLERRLKGEPTAYILKQKEFYGIDFYVDSRVLIPRPETEILVDAVLDVAMSRNYPTSQLLIADIGTGCGAIAISLALHLPECRVYATDLSYSALEVASWNCRWHGVTEKVSLLQGDLLKPLPESVDLIVANLPYIGKHDIIHLSPEISEFEPRVALDGGENGLDCIERLLLQLNDKINTGGCLILEIGDGQEEKISRLLKVYIKSTNFRFAEDLNTIRRAVIIDI